MKQTISTLGVVREQAESLQFSHQLAFIRSKTLHIYHFWVVYATSPKHSNLPYSLHNNKHKEDVQEQSLDRKTGSGLIAVYGVLQL